MLSTSPCHTSLPLFCFNGTKSTSNLESKSIMKMETSEWKQQKTINAIQFLPRKAPKRPLNCETHFLGGPSFQKQQESTQKPKRV